MRELIEAAKQHRERYGRWFFWDELKPLDWDKREFIRGNIVAFGWWDGIGGSATLMSPLLNFIVHFKHRGKELGFTDATGAELDVYADHALKERLSSGCALTPTTPGTGA